MTGPRASNVTPIIGAARKGGDMRLAVFHYPIENWADAVVMNVLQGLATGIQMTELTRVSYAPLAEVFREIAPREARHAELGSRACERIASTPEGGRAAKAALAYWKPRVATSFGVAGSGRFETLQEIRPAPHAQRGACSRNGKKAVARAPGRARALEAARPMDGRPHEEQGEDHGKHIPRRLASYVSGAWTAGKGEGQPLLDAATGEVVALIDSKGLDFADALNYGRSVPGRSCAPCPFTSAPPC